jgi:Tfp pilus assembly protein PilP
MEVNLHLRSLATPLAILLAAVFFVACGDDEEYRRSDFGHVRPGQSSIEARKRIKQQGAGLVEKGADKAKGDFELPKLSETDFIEGPKHRDPFRAHVEVVARQEAVERIVQREIKLSEYDVSDLKLIGIITNIGDPRAMVTTPNGEGIVLRRGDYVGRADFIDQGSSGEKLQVNWRVARIHGSGKEEERGIYLIRDDPRTSPGSCRCILPANSRPAPGATPKKKATKIC